MARPWRVEFPGAVYHVTSRGNNRQRIFIADDNRREFVGLLARAAGRFELKLLAFCLMSNHYHLFLRTPKANLASAMHWLNAVYTMRFNQRQGRCGHVLQGRYRAVLVEDLAHWWRVSIYVHLNPVRAGMVEGPEEYEWSSYRDYVRARSRFGWVSRDEILAGLGGSAAGQRRRYRLECERLAGRRPDYWDRFRREMEQEHKEALQRLGQRGRPVGDARAVPEYLRARRACQDPDAELARVAAAFGEKKDALLPRRRGSVARQAAYYHLTEHCGIRAAQVAAIMGVSPSAVTKGVKAVSALLQDDDSLEAAMNSLIP